MMAENMTLDNETRNELLTYAVELLYDHLHDIIMRNMSKLEFLFKWDGMVWRLLMDQLKLLSTKPTQA